MFHFFLDSHCGMLSTDFMPHGHCYFWRPEIVWSHAISDALIAISYYIIPYGLVKLIRKRPDLKYKNIFLLFGLFIVACGTTHILSIINIWNPLYRTDAVVKIITAMASLPTAIILLKILPQAVKIPSLGVWEEMNKNLQEQIVSLKEKDKTIEKSKELEFLANSIPQLVWTSDSAGKGEYYNDHWQAYTGLDFNKEKNRDWSVILHPDDVDRTRGIWARSIQTGEAYEIEYRFRRASDGEYRWHLGRAIAMKDENGHIRKWFGTCTDIHDFKMAQQAAKQSKEKLESVINNAPISLWSVNKEGIFTLSEGKALQSLGLKPGEVVGRQHAAVFPSPELTDRIKRTLEGESFVSINEIQGNTFETYYNPLKDDNDAITGMVGVSLDITQRKQAEKANALKTKFLANMSHELRTPLNAVIGFAGVLNKTDLDIRQKQYVNLINQAGQLLLKLIGDVLDLSKIEEGKLVIEPESFHLKDTINSSLYPYKVISQEGGSDFDILFDDKLPEFVIGDKFRINQILVNLLGNSIKFTKKGRILVKIDCLELNHNKAKIKFSVADSGIGISKEKHETIFDSYTQADPDIKKEFGGSGLGLSIVKQLIDLMEGEIHIESPHSLFSVPTGTCFWFVLELEADNQKQNVERPVEDPLSYGVKNGAKIRVLVAEDNEVNQILARIVLKSLGCEVDFASNGKECVRMLSGETVYDIVLMDIQMPVMDGLEATRIIRNELKSTVPIIGFSANVSKEDITLSLNAGMNDHIGKPYSEEHIYKIIKKWTDKEPAEQVANLSYIQKLVENKEEIRKILTRALSQANEYFDKMEDCIKNKDWKELSFYCHTYKSSARIVGATKFQLILDDLEYYAENETPDRILTLFDSALEMNSKLKEELQEAITKL